MTGPTPRRQGPSPSGGGLAPTGTYRLYRFYDGQSRLLYVGVTGRRPLKRLLEHVDDKPWSDLMERWEADRQVWASEAAVLAAEKAAIEAERPLHNIEHNMGNAHRVPPWEAKAQRAQRDAARGVFPAQRRTPTSPRQAPTRPRQPWWVQMTETLPFRAAVLWLAIALAVAVGVGRVLAEFGLAVSAVWPSGVGAAVATGVLIRWWRPVKRLLHRR